VNNAVNGGDEAAHFLAVDVVDELTGDRRVVLERHNALSLVKPEVSTFESPVGVAVAHRPSSHLRSYQVQSIAEHHWAGALVSAASLRCMAYGFIAGVVLRIVVELVCTPGFPQHRPITSVIKMVLLQLFDQAMDYLEPLSVVLRELHFLVVASTSVTTVCLTVYLSMLTTMMYLLIKELEVEAQMELEASV